MCSQIQFTHSKIYIRADKRSYKQAEAIEKERSKKSDKEPDSRVLWKSIFCINTLVVGEAHPAVQKLHSSFNRKAWTWATVSFGRVSLDLNSEMQGRQSNTHTHKKKSQKLHRLAISKGSNFSMTTKLNSLDSKCGPTIQLPGTHQKIQH